MLNHKGMPETSMLSIRAGNTRRQAPITELNRPMKFPTGPDENTHFKIDVLDLIGTTRQTYHAAQTEYRFQLENPSERGKLTDIEVAFAVRTKVSDKGPQSETDPEDEKLDKKKEQGARDYLDQHGLTSFMQFLMQSLMKDKPADPYGFLHKQVTKRMVTQLSKTIGGANTRIPDDKEIESMVSRLYQHSPTDVTAEQMATLERDCAAARAQLQIDNAKLQETTEQLKAKYDIQETSDSQPPLDVTREPAIVQRLPLDDPRNVFGSEDSIQLSAYKEIAGMQDEVSALAQENAALVQQLASMRASIDAVRGDIDSMSKPAS